MDKEFDLRLVIKIFRDFWWKILIGAIILALVLGAYAAFFVDKKYESTFSLIIINKNNNDYTQSSVVDANEILGAIHSKISTSDEVIEKIAKHMADNPSLANGKSEAQLVRAVKSSMKVKANTTGEMSYTITTSNPELSYDIARAASEIIPEQMSKDYYKFPTRVLNRPTVAVLASPNVPMYAIVGFAAGAFLVWLIYFVKSLIDTSIITKKDITSRFSYPVIGEIPRW